MYTQGCTSDNGGDPHFTRWNQNRRDTFQGECDLVLMQAPARNFELHVRTTSRLYYSYIAAAAIQLGEHIFQVDAEKPHAVRLDGVKHSLALPSAQDTQEGLSSRDSVPSLVFGSGNATYKYVFEEHHSSPKKHVYRLDVSDWSYLRFKMYGAYLTVSVHAGHDEDFQGAVGLLGRYPDGKSVTREEGGDRDAGSMSFNDFGMEWQVDPTRGDPMLFHTARSPQLPYERCSLPTAAHPWRRQLLRGGISHDQAMQVCRHHGVSLENLDLCVDDVLSTGEVDLAAIW